MSEKMVRIPKALANKIDGYYSTRAFACCHGVKFNKDMLLDQIEKMADRHHFTVEGTTGNFILRRKGSVLQVTPESFPMAIKIH